MLVPVQLPSALPCCAERLSGRICGYIEPKRLMSCLLVVEGILVSRKSVTSNGMTTLSPLLLLKNVKALLAQVLAESERIKDSL